MPFMLRATHRGIVDAMRAEMETERARHRVTYGQLIEATDAIDALRGEVADLLRESAANARAWVDAERVADELRAEIARMSVRGTRGRFVKRVDAL